MKPVVLITALGLGLGAVQAWAACEKIVYVESVRAYSGTTVNKHIFLRETGADTPQFVVNTRDASLVNGALWAHVHRTPVKIKTSQPVCLTPQGGLWTNLSTLTNLVLAP